MGSKKILIAPLDWGLGHATRCVPVIKELLKEGHQVIVAADGITRDLLLGEFPQLQFIHLTGYGLTYSRRIPAWLKIVFQVPKIIYRIIAEHGELKRIISKNKIDVVVSDNRFGLWNKKVCSVYITHQVMIKCPPGLKLFEPLLHYMHKWFIKKYDFCWIPDYDGIINLSGDLSHKYPLPANARFIGPLSRFTYEATEKTFEHDLCVIVSGPEPARSKFENIILSQLQQYEGKAILVIGKPGEKTETMIRNTKVVSHLSGAGLSRAIASSSFVICRAGYSGIMDLSSLGKDALLIPTPGQTEQEYLGEYLSAKKIFASVKEAAFDLKSACIIPGYSVRNNFNAGQNSLLLSEAVRQLKDCG